jgi:hypothetical protein
VVRRPGNARDHDANGLADHRGSSGDRLCTGESKGAIVAGQFLGDRGQQDFFARHIDLLYELSERFIL